MQTTGNVPYSLPFKPGQNLIELGGGETPYIRPNVDFRQANNVDIVADLSEPLPLEDEAYDGVMCSYAIEHISWRKVQGFINEIFRILTPGGKAVIITANLYEQSRRIVNAIDMTQNDVCMVFGDQNYSGNSHQCGFSPELAFQYFTKAGFQDILIVPHDNTNTDMIIEVCKPFGTNNPNNWTTSDRQRAFGQTYFNGGGAIGGYAYEGYWDYPIHWNMAQIIMNQNPKSVLEIGCARGYVLKRLEDTGIPVVGLDVSEHCYKTRATNAVQMFDITTAPWPLADKSIDLAISFAVLEHIPEDKVSIIASELDRVSCRGLHFIDMQQNDMFDRSHVTIRQLSWWKERLPKSQYPADKAAIQDLRNPPGGDGKLKLNIGCFKTMFHHGWVNIDIHDLNHWAQQHAYAFQQMDVTKGLNCLDNSVDMIYSAHFLEHITYQQGQEFLRRCYAALKPGGIIRISVPSTRELMSLYLDNKMGEVDAINPPCARAKNEIVKLWHVLMTNHQAMYDDKALCNFLTIAGFNAVSVMKFRESSNQQILAETIDMLPDITLIVEAVK